MQLWLDSLWHTATLTLPAMAFLYRQRWFPRWPRSALLMACCVAVYGLVLLRLQLSASESGGARLACDARAELAANCGSPPWFAPVVEAIASVMLAFLIVEGVRRLTRRFRGRP